MLEVEWTGEYPALCSGEWIIKYDGKELEVPEDVKYSSMYTYGSYRNVHLINYEDIENNLYNDGLKQNEWIKVNKGWASRMFKKADIEVDRALLKELYNKINEQDFRSFSCGGCFEC